MSRYDPGCMPAAAKARTKKEIKQWQCFLKSKTKSTLHLQLHCLCCLE